MTKGETLKLSVSDANAVSVDFAFGGVQARSIAATKSGTDFSITADTTSWQAGTYAWQAWATDAEGCRSIIATGTLDLADALGVGDVRSQARKMVDMIESMMAGNASEGVRRYRINNRELERYSVAELMQLLSYWRERAKRERRDGGLGPRISVRF